MNSKQGAWALYAALLEEKPIDNAANHEEPIKLPTLESTTQRAIIDLLSWKQMKGELFFSRINVTGIYDQKAKAYRSLPRGETRGFPDIIVLKAGKLIAIEVKSNIGKQSVYQEAAEQQFLKHGAVYILARTALFVEQKLSQY